MSAAHAPSTDTRAWQTVLNTIEGDLLSGVLRPGDHLPAERTLASDLGVGRSSVREALRVLEVLGLIRTQTGSGPHAGAIIVATPSGGMSALMRLQVAAQGFPVPDVVKTRLVLETSTVAELASESSAADLAPSRTLLDAMDSPTLTEAEFLALDARFHLTLAEATGNQVVAAMMGGLRDSIERYSLEGAARLPSWATTVDRLRAEHRSVIAAIDDQDPTLARTRIHDHITTYYGEILPHPVIT